MRSITVNLALLLLALPQPGRADWLFFKSRPPAVEQVKDLLHQLKDSRDADERQDAAESLHDFDGQTFPEIVPALIEALRKDSSTGVRRAAARSLGRIRPTSLEAAEALEYATKHDSSAFVRLQARTARLGYRAPESAPPPAPGESGFIIVPPPGPDGRLTPVPVPTTVRPANLRPLPQPKPVPPAVTPQPANSPPDQTEGPILVAPKP
jgi:hypothetical protein